MKNITKNNTSFFINDRHESWWNNVSDNTWEPYTFDIIDKYVTKNSVCIDLGAWIGPVSLYLGQKSKCVYSIEPDVEAIYDLQLNVAANPNCNIYIKNCAISDIDGFLKLGNDQSLGNSTTRRGQTFNTFNIKCFTLSSFCNINNITHVDFIKIDVEGSEEIILKDIEFFKKYKPTVYIQLHNFWFENKQQGNQVAKNIAALYKNVYDESFKHINYEIIDGGSYIFTDLDL